MAFLGHIQDVLRREALPPCTKQELLALIDLKAKTKSELATILKVSDALPAEFPAVPSWLTKSS
jgi:hypothetical protein